MQARKGPSPEVTQFLRSQKIFGQLRESSIRCLAEAARFRRVQKGEVLFFHTDPADCVFVARSGGVSVVLNSPDGREMVIDEMRAGDLFGELGLITRNSRSASAVVRTGGEVLVIQGAAFLKTVDEEPRLVRLLLEATAQRLQASTRREMALAFMNAHSRLARILLDLEERERDRGYVTISQEELARGTGLIRQTVAKALGEWRRKGWLLTGRGRIVILNRKALEGVERGQIEFAVVSSK